MGVSGRGEQPEEPRADEPVKQSLNEVAAELRAREAAGPNDAVEEERRRQLAAVDDLAQSRRASVEGEMAAQRARALAELDAPFEEEHEARLARLERELALLRTEKAELPEIPVTVIDQARASANEALDLHAQALASFGQEPTPTTQAALENATAGLKTALGYLRMVEDPAVEYIDDAIWESMTEQERQAWAKEQLR